MNFNTDRIKINKTKMDYPKGTKVVLINMEDKYAPPVGTKGEVMFVDDIGTIHTRWENGSSLGVVLGIDTVEKIVK